MKEKVPIKFYDLKREIGYYIQNKLDLNDIYNDDEKRLIFKRIINKRDKKFGIHYIKSNHKHNNDCDSNCDKHLDTCNRNIFEKKEKGEGDHYFTDFFTDSRFGRTTKLDTDFVNYMKMFSNKRRSYFIESTPLEFSILCENAQSMEFLLKNGAKPEIVENWTIILML